MGEGVGGGVGGGVGVGMWGCGGWGCGGERCTCGLKCCTNQIVQGSINVIVTDTFPGSTGLRI